MSSYSDFLSTRSNDLLSFYKSFFDPNTDLDFNQFAKAFKREIEFFRSSWNYQSGFDFVNSQSIIGLYNTLNSQLEEIKLLAEEYYSDDTSKNSLLLTYINKHQLMHEEIVNLLRRIRQKLNTLENLNQGYQSVLLENFSNLDYIFNNSDKESFLVDTYAKVATLNNDGKFDILNVTNIKLGGTSNGLSGDYDFAINADLNSLIDGDPTTYYSYHKINEGPLYLSLVFEFSQTQIINELRVLPQSKFQSFDYEIDDVIYETSSIQKTSIKDLIDINEQTLRVRILEKESLNTYKHLPVIANKCTIKFIQKSPYISYTNNIETQIYSIAIKDVSFIRNKYLSESILNSTNFNLDSNTVSLTGEIKAFPANFNFYDLDFSYALENAESNAFVLNSNFKTNTVNVDANNIQFSYSLFCKRNSDGFKNFSFYNSENIYGIIKKQISRVNPNLSPNYISFDANYISDSLVVAQPKVAVISNEVSKAIKLGKPLIGPIKTSVELPINIFEYGFSLDDLIIYGNRIEWESTYNENQLTLNQYILSTTGKSILVNIDTATVIQLSFSLKEKIATVEDIGEQYIVYLNEHFDYDKDVIFIKNLRRAALYSEIFPRPSNGELRLTHPNISNIVLRNLETDSIIDASLYRIISNTSNSIIKLLQTNDLTSALQVDYSYISEVNIDSKEIYFKDRKPAGILINKSDVLISNKVNSGLVINEASDICNSFDFEDKNLVLKSIEFEDLYKDYYVNGAYNQQNLTDIDYAARNYKEVQYIDGIREFLKIENVVEVIPSEELGADNFINGNEYYLLARITKIPFANSRYNFKVDLYNSMDDRLYSLSKNESLSLDYIVEQTPEVLLANADGLYNPINGLCLLKLDTSLTGMYISDYKIKYISKGSYSEIQESDFLFSVDYVNSIVYLNHPILKDTLEAMHYRYSLSNIKASYEILKKYKKWEYDKIYKTIQLDNNELNEDSLFVKILYNESQSNVNLTQIEPYFSPLFYQIKIGLN